MSCSATLGPPKTWSRRPSAACTGTGPGLPIRQRRCRTCGPRCLTAAGQRSGGAGSGPARPSTSPPLRLTRADPAPPRSRHWWLTPLAAAASVAAVLAGLIFVGHAPVTGHGGAWPGSAALSRAQARLTKQALDSYFPATGAQYTAGLAFGWTRQKILARDIGPCLAAAGFQQPPFSVPKRKFILHSSDNSQFPDLAQRLRAGVMTPGNANRPGQVAGEQRIWTPVFVTCARPAVATMERLQLTERSAFFRQHGGQIRTIRRLVIDLLPRHQT